MSIALTPLTKPHHRHPEMFERFLAETAGHQMTIVLDTPDIKHLQFADPDGGFYGFRVTVTPWNVAINGGMGSYSFSNSEGDTFASLSGSGINPGYWEEKLRSVDVNAQCRVHSADAVTAWAHDQWESKTHRLSEKKAREVWDSIEQDFLDIDNTEYDHEHASHTYLAFENFRGVHGFEFDTPEDKDFTAYSAQYLWTLHALVWAAKSHFNHIDKDPK